MIVASSLSCAPLTLMSQTLNRPARSCSDAKDISKNERQLVDQIQCLMCLERITYPSFVLRAPDNRHVDGWMECLVGW